MAAKTFSHANSGRMYSWWWDSHVSPKNSKWLQDNLTDMDVKVKSMIKLIEEDADSFARRAEMYYKKRPELMKMVEEFYRAYRALAERYDHATGVIRHAHRTMEEAFPNQVPPMLDDSSSDISTPGRGFFDPEDFQNETPGSFSLSNDSKKSNGIGKFNEGKVRKTLNFHESVVRERSVENEAQTLSPRKHPVPESEEIVSLKKVLAELEEEKEAGNSRYQKSMEKLSILESEISRVQENSERLSEKARLAEAEAQSLKETLAKVESEKESSILQYHECVEKISELESSVSRARELADELAKVTAEKDAALDQYMSSLEKISSLEHKLKCAEEDALMFKVRAEKAEKEVELLKQAVSRLTEEKEAAEVQYRQSTETISGLESSLGLARAEAERLRSEIEKGINDLKGAEEQCVVLEQTNRSLQTELEALVVKTGSQSQELTDKQKELGRLWTCVQEERFRFVEAETAFQTLQHLHAQAQEELRSLATELQLKVQALAETESQRKNLQDEVLLVKEENQNLHTSSAISIRGLENEISTLTGVKGRLEEEVVLRVDQKNALQQEIYCMKEELSDLKRRNSSIMEQVLAAGLDAESFGSSVKVLQAENSSLKETGERERSEKLALLEKLKILEQLLEKNTVLENSLSDLNAEMEAIRGNIQSLEESCRSLVDEKVSLQTQLQIANGNLGELTEKNSVLESSLGSANGELEALRIKSTSLEESSRILADENARVSAELQTTETRLENLETRYTEIAEKCSSLEKEKELSASKIQELQVSLDLQKREHSNEAERLQEEIRLTKAELEKELDNAFASQTEVFILRRCAKDLEDRNFSLLTKNQNQKCEIVSLSEQGNILRNGVEKLLKALDIVVLDGDCRDEICLSRILNKLEDVKRSSFETGEETLRRSVELSVLLTMLGDLNLRFEILESELSVSQNEAVSLREMNEEIKDEVLEGKRKHEAFVVLVSDLQKQITGLQRENGVILEKNSVLERENSSLNGEVLSLDCQSIFLKNCISENFEELNATERKFMELLHIKESELQKLREEHQQTKVKEETLKNEVETWEGHASEAFVEIQVSNLFQTLYEEKIRELSGTCHALKDENEGLHVKFAACIPAITSLTAQISSLEEHTSSHEIIANPKDDVITASREVSIDPISDLRDLAKRIQSIEKAVISKELILLHENRSVHSELEAAMKQFADLRSANSHRRRNSRPSSEVLEADGGILTKDIMLDHVSEFSPYRRSSRRERESWEIIDQNGSIDLMVNKESKTPTERRSVKKMGNDRNALPTAEIMVEKEVGVDKLEISKRFSEPGKEGSQRKVLERLNSDVQKLANLEITVQDLKQKLDSVGKSKKGKAVDECDILKEQLEEAYAAILKLFDLNGKLTKNIEDAPLSSPSDESANEKKRKVGEQARRMSERIGRLQLEVQKIQYVLVKLDDEKDGRGKGKSKDGDSKIRVPLRNYLYGYGYGVGRSSQRRKKTPFCGCVQPRTQGD